MEQQPTKSMAELKIDIIEVIVNSPVGIDIRVDDLIKLCEKSADFVFSYRPPLTAKPNGV